MDVLLPGISQEKVFCMLQEVSDTLRTRIPSGHRAMTHPQASFYIEFKANTVLFIVDLQLSRSQWCKVLQIFKMQKALSNLH